MLDGQQKFTVSSMRKRKKKEMDYKRLNKANP